ncbi:hypothetical protein A8U91_04712 [Halomonas elongata]|uniref:Uncharacterized protein n=1 Tax=Halomonas elongata TaxID=2746 RepID=A0A1B8P080_HALEL|nr:hypothetical protein [Halomonas elongata]OBX35638.1 hypothetical protein A8U91_04712 [Halomonas elongata]
MHTTTTTPCRVYLHPAAITSMIAVRAIEHVTGRVAYVHPIDNRVRLITQAEHARLSQPGGAA